MVRLVGQVRRDLFHLTGPLGSLEEAAFMFKRSIRPLKPSSLPIGRYRGVVLTLIFSSILARALKKAARSRSMRLMKTIRGSLYSSAYSHTFWVWNSTPPTASTTTTAPSTIRRQFCVSKEKLESPGVSTMLTLHLFQSKKLLAEVMDTCRFCSSGSKSMQEEPSSTRPRRSVLPATKRKDSHREVLPVPPCPTTAMFLMDFDSYFAMTAPFSP